MNRAQKYFLHLPEGTHFEKIVDTEYGKENIYVSPDGKKTFNTYDSRYDFIRTFNTGKLAVWTIVYPSCNFCSFIDMTRGFNNRLCFRTGENII